MTAALELSLSLATRAASRDNASRAFDEHGADDLYMTWKAVFQRVQATELSRAEPRPSAAVTQGGQDHAYGSGPVPGGPPQGDPELATPAVRAIAAHIDAVQIKAALNSANGCIAPPGSPAGSAGLSASKAAQSQANPENSTAALADVLRTGAPSIATSTWIAQLSNSAPSAEAAADAAATDVRAEARPAASLLASTLVPSAAESVSIFVDGTTVTLVVRDSAITREAALHCAFETARALTGQRGALRRLTLNGRTLYQSVAEGHAGDQPGNAVIAALRFTC